MSGEPKAPFSSPSNTLTVRAAAVARACPQEWEQFLAALKAYTDHKKDQCVSSQVADIQVAQGHAREAGMLLRQLSDCVRTADQMLEKIR